MSSNSSNMKKEPPDEPLSSLLREWKVSDEPAPGFADEVWRRVQRNNAPPRTASWLSRWRSWIGGLAQSHDFAWGMAAALVLVMGAGWLGTRGGETPKTGAPSPGSYLASVDPYRMSP